MPVSLRTLMVLALGALIASGCAYSRKELTKKRTPPKAKIFVDFKVDQSAVQAMRSNAQSTNQNSSAFESNARRVGPAMTAMMKTELAQRGIGFAVVDPGAPVDLVLRGTFRAGNGSIDCDWELVHVQSKAVVTGGTASDTWFTGNPEPYADQVLENLLAMDVDRYAANAGGDTPPPPGPAQAGLEPPKSTTPGDNAWAVIVGVETYREKLPVATHAEADAQAFQEYAEKTLGVPPAHIKVLVGERAGRADMASALLEWLPRNAVKPGGRVYFFFSGHGAPDPETGAAYLVPWDADPAYLKTRGLALDELYGALNAIKDHQVYVFLDACFSGAGDRSVLAAGTRPLVPVSTPKVPAGVITLSASQARETTGAARDGAHGLFTWHLLSGMGGAADQDGDKTVTFAELSAYVTDKVQTDARLDNREQTPSAQLPDGVSGHTLRLVEGIE